MPLMLLVDDDEDVRAAFGQVLRRRGHSIAEASNGGEALALLNAGLRPSLILLDNDMPVLDGCGFREAQLNDPQLARIPVVLVTGQNDLETLVDVMRPVAIVQKPVGSQTFLTTVDLVLERLGIAEQARL